MPGKKIKLREDGNRYITKARVGSKGELTDVKVRRTVKGLITGAPSVKKAEAASKMKKGGVKKYKPGGVKEETPFQRYLKDNKGAVAKDTVGVRAGVYLPKFKTTEKGKTDDGIKSPNAKNPKNQAALNKAFDKTYGQDRMKVIGESSDPNESLEQYRRRMGSTYKKGGVKKTVVKKYQGGGKKKSAIPKTPIKAKSGPTVKAMWEEKTGTPWKDAKERGLTDGSRSKNMRIREDLKKGETFGLGSKLRSSDNADEYKRYKERITFSDGLKYGGTKEGFKVIQAAIAKKQGISLQAAGAILASSSRKASPKAKKANPKLLKVKGKTKK
jgi:hypothetical protein